MSLRNLEHQQQYSKSVITLHNRMQKIAEDKIEIVKKLNPLYESQFVNYDPAIEVECHKLCAQINMLDITQEELTRLINECDKHSKPMIELGTRIQELENTIPDFKKFKKWTIKGSESEPVVTNTCAQEVMSFGI